MVPTATTCIGNTSTLVGSLESGHCTRRRKLATSLPVEHYDVLVIGAGTAGTTVAWKCAAKGLRVLLVDQRQREKTGAAWVNGVEQRLFDRLGMGAPEPPVLSHHPSVVHLVSPGSKRVTVSGVPAVDIDMPSLTADLLRRAERAKVELKFETSFRDLLVASGRVIGARLQSKSTPVTVRAPVTVDASGMKGAVRVRLPSSLWQRESFSETEICVADRQVYEIRDIDAAKALLKREGIRPGERLVWSGLRGGYSVLDISLDLERRELSILTGAMRWSQGPHAAAELMEEGIERLGFVGARISGGAGPIPTRRAFDQLVGNGFALVGDAAGQVFPAHGSGVAAGMYAADILARTIFNAVADGSVDKAGLWSYAAEYQRTRGALCASYEWVRRLSESIAPEQMNRMISTGLIDPATAVRVISCRPFKLTPRQVLATVKTSMLSPRLSRRVVGASARAAIAYRHYQRYPREWHPNSFASWRRFTHSLFEAQLR